MTKKSASETLGKKPTKEDLPKKEPLHREVDIKKHKDEANKLNEKSDEYGGQDGPDPTRYGDWEKGGRCTDF